MAGDPIIKAKEAMKKFVGEMNEEFTKIGVLAFSDKTKMVVKPTNEYAQVIKGIDKIAVGEVGYGNAAEPFTDASNELQIGRFGKKKESIRYLIVLTDGVWSNSRHAVKQAQNCHKEGIEVIALGFGGADYKFLKEIASTDEFASITNLTELAGSFSKIAQVIGDSTPGSSIKMY